MEATLYFVACEALANVVKHAKADSAMVTVRAGGSRLEMEISDDGVGGVTDQAARPVRAWPTWPTGSARSTGKSSSSARQARERASWEDAVRVAIAEDSGLFRSSLALLLAHSAPR